MLCNRKNTLKEEGFAENLPTLRPFKMYISLLLKQNSCREILMGAVRTRVQTADKNITIIHK